MNYQQAFFQVIVADRSGKTKHVVPTSIATPPWTGCWHPYIHLYEEKKWSEVSWVKQQSDGNARTQT